MTRGRSPCPAGDSHDAARDRDPAGRRSRQTGVGGLVPGVGGRWDPVAPTEL